jgi:hypothetical protein
MTVQDELVHAGVGAPVIEALEDSNSCQARSADELRAITGRGLHAGDLYFAAAAELERRARASDAAAQAEQAETATRRQHIIILVAALITAATAILVLLM